MNRDATNDGEALPVATVRERRRSVWVWLIPAAAVVFAAALFVAYVIKRGPVINITMAHGYGLKAGDVLRCRGIVTGAVEQVRLTSGLSGVEAKVRLDPTAVDLARDGSRFWVVRPRVNLTGIVGLETIAGPRYLAVLPGSGARRKRFEALDQPPSIESIAPDGLRITLVADRRRSLRPGAPVFYRQVRIGTVLRVELAADGVSVEVAAYIEPSFTHLVREDSRFWNVSGVDLELGLKGLRLEVESLQSILDGGISLATPDPPGVRVKTGHRFILHASAEKKWLGWRPVLSAETGLPSSDPVD